MRRANGAADPIASIDHPPFDVFRCLNCGRVNWKQAKE
jgi:hypothetical protein